jgi:hypothetical protein
MKIRSQLIGTIVGKFGMPLPNHVGLESSVVLLVCFKVLYNITKLIHKLDGQKYTITAAESDKMGRVRTGVATRSKKAVSAAKGRKTSKANGGVSRNRKKVIDLSPIVVEDENVSDESENEEEEEEEEEEEDEYEYDDEDDDDDNSGIDETILVKNEAGKKGKKEYAAADIESEEVSSDDEIESKEGGKGGVKKGQKGTVKKTAGTGTGKEKKEAKKVLGSKVAKGVGKKKGQKKVGSNSGATNTAVEARRPATTVATASGTNMLGGGSSGSNVQVRDLASFGLTAAPGRAEELIGLNNNHQNTAEIRIVIIEGINGQSDILFRCHPTGQGNRNNSWCEKLVHDAVKGPDTWTNRFGMSKQVFTWFDNNIQQFNRAGFGIRLFHIPVTGNVEIESVVQLFSHMCDIITASPRNNERITVTRENLLWLPGRVVWSDVVGRSKALAMIKYQKGNPHPGYYEANEEFILTYVRGDDAEAMRELYGPVLEEAEE